MTQEEIEAQKKRIEYYFREEKSLSSLSKYEAWDTWNYILNTVRQKYHKALVSPSENPFINNNTPKEIRDDLGVM